MFADVYYGCGRFLYAKGEYRQSKEYYTKAIALDSKNPLFYKQLGKALAELNRYDKAIEAYITATELLLDNKKLDDDEERTQSTLIDKITATGLFISSQQSHHVQAAHTDLRDDSNKPSQVASSINELSLAKDRAKIEEEASIFNRGNVLGKTKVGESVHSSLNIFSETDTESETVQ